MDSNDAVANAEIDAFWAVVEHVRKSFGYFPDAEEIPGPLEDQLCLGGREMILIADRAFRALANASYTWRLWGAAYLINGGCSDDGFDYFRGWLIAQGRAVYDAAMADPDSLAAILTDEDADTAECEDIWYVTAGAYRRVGGRDLPMTAREALPELNDDLDFDDDEQMRALFPRLVAIFRA